jgi:hypothetical protein
MFPDHEKMIKEYEQFTDNEGQMMAIVHVNLMFRWAINAGKISNLSKLLHVIYIVPW